MNLDKLLASRKAVIFMQNDCKWCVAAAEHLSSLGFEFEKINVQFSNEAQAMMIEKEWDTVPQIFIDGNHVGDYSALVENHPIDLPSPEFDALLRFFMNNKKVTADELPKVINALLPEIDKEEKSQWVKKAIESTNHPLITEIDTIIPNL